MDALLPSEIARLVLGYLQEQKCEEAAKIFMETSPLLQECRIVAQRGGRYSTKVGGLSLIDILDKYCATNALVQEKLSKVSDCEQLKQCNDLLEQLRYLLEGSRGHRFVVNISVPTQNSPSGGFGSPIGSGSLRRRHHSNSERGKRAAKSLTNLLDKPIQNPISQNCDMVEATPLESLPGHQSSTKQIQIDTETDVNILSILSNKSTTKNDGIVNSSMEDKTHVPMLVDTHLDSNLIALNSNNINLNHKNQSNEIVQKNDVQQIKSKCTAGTSTEELLNYCSTEVQTGPCDLLESESYINDEPIENLSILTKRLLQRTELHQRIAENINKAILPVETCFREENVSENATETNMSLLTDYDNAIKSVVQATEADPIFEGFLHEIFKIGEADTSPDEDSDNRQNYGLNEPAAIQSDEPMKIDNSNELTDSIESKVNDNEVNSAEVPLKHRLRSSSRSQNTNIDDEEIESNSVLENQNAEAIMNIVNVIANKRNSLVNNESDTNVPAETLAKNALIVEAPINNVSIETERSNEDNKSVNSTKLLQQKKGSNKKMKSSKQKSIAENANNNATGQIVLEQEIMTMPTLILCSEKEVESLLQSDGQRTKSRKENFIPIAPKPIEINSTVVEPTPPMIYLRTVNVPRHLLSPAQIEASSKMNPLFMQQTLQIQQPLQVQPTPSKSLASASSVEADPTGESITLYGGENDSAAVKVPPIASMPVINLDDSMIDLGKGLSPFFKAEETKVAEKPMDVETSIEPDKKSEETIKTANATLLDDVIAKHTPRTLLKARAKNNRLSLSTPRRRNSHVRALDFNTPLKIVDGAKKLPQSCGKSKSVCRAGLFRSPPFANENDVELPKQTSAYMHVPIATRTPVPKLQGNWSKLTGIGLILGDASASESSPEKIQPEPPPTLVKKSWDSDLRKIVGSAVVDAEIKPIPRTARKARRRITPAKNAVAGRAIRPKVQELKNETKMSPQFSKSSNDAAVKVSPDVGVYPAASRFPDLLDLETPRKTEVTFYVPPTPQLLNTPGDSLVKSGFSRSGHEFDIKDCVDTPEFPITPCIVLTPKIIEEDHEKKSSPYYEPSDDQTQPTKAKELANTEKTMMQETTTTTTATTMATSMTITTGTMTTTVVAAMAMMTMMTTTTTTTEKSIVELKENLAEEVKSDLIKGAERQRKVEEEKEEEPTSEETSKEIIEDESVEDTNASDSDSGNESSDSSSSSSSNSSSSSSSSSSSCSSNTSTPMKLAPVEETPPSVNNVSAESRVNSPSRVLQIFSKFNEKELDKIECEISPIKIHDDSLQQETPAKTEGNVIPEAEISETPSVSELERAIRRDSLPGLTSKMSMAITTPRSNQPTAKVNDDTCAVSSSEKPPGKPKIINVQRLVPGAGMALQVSKMLQSQKEKSSGPTMQQQQQLSQQLEEKRLRVMAKFKEAAKQPRKGTDEIRQRKARRGVEAEKLVTSTTDSFKKKQKQTAKEKQLEAKNESRVVRSEQQNTNRKAGNAKASEDCKEARRVKLRTSLRNRTTRDEQAVKAEVAIENPCKVEKEVPENTVKEPSPNTAENLKGILKAKVDQVKRDLFSDEEVNDQRTTRSQAARRTVDIQRIDENLDAGALFDNVKEKQLPGVLECLQLIPANKNEQELHELSGKSSSSDGLSNSQTNALDVSFMYDESVPIKKRKRKYSNSELASEYTFRYPDEIHVLSVTAYEEMFKIAPKVKKKIQSPKKSPAKVKKMKSCDKSVEKTLACSLVANSLNIKSENLHSDKKRKSCKRKTPIKECKKVEKRKKPDPQALFNKIKIDEFLKSVHVPE